MDTWNCEVSGDHTTLHILLRITHYFYKNETSTFVQISKIIETIQHQ